MKERKTAEMYFNDILEIAKNPQKYSRNHNEYTKPAQVRFNLPAVLVDYVIKTICEFNGITMTEFYTQAIINGIVQKINEDKGGKTFVLPNPQESLEAGEDTKIKALKALADLTQVGLDRKLGYNTGIYDLADFIHERLCAENKNGEFLEVWQHHGYDEIDVIAAKFKNGGGGDAE